MKVTTNNAGSCKSTMVGEEIVFTIGNSDKIIGLLRHNMYSFPIRTLVQEYVSNALDACIEAGKDGSAVTITLPTYRDSRILIRDYGVGLSDSRVRDILTKYGNSTKDGSDKELGGFGIGSKSAWAYTDSFTMTSWHDGQKTVYLAHIGSNESGSLKVLSQEPSTEKTGVEVQIAVKPSDIEEFINAVSRATFLWSKKPKVINNKDEYPEAVYKFGCMTVYKKSGGWINTISDSYRDTSTEVLISAKGIPYELKMELPFDSEFVYVFHVEDISKLQISTNRETFRNEAFARGVVDATVKEFKAFLKTCVASTLQETRKNLAPLEFARFLFPTIGPLTNSPVPKVTCTGMVSRYVKSARANLSKARKENVWSCNGQKMYFTRTSFANLAHDDSAETRRRINVLGRNGGVEILARTDASLSIADFEKTLAFMNDPAIIDLDSLPAESVKAARVEGVRMARYRTIDVRYVRRHGSESKARNDAQELASLMEKDVRIVWCSRKEFDEMSDEDVRKVVYTNNAISEYKLSDFEPVEFVEVNREGEKVLRDESPETAIHYTDWLKEVHTKELGDALVAKIGAEPISSEDYYHFENMNEKLVKKLSKVVPNIPELKAELKEVNEAEDIERSVRDLLASLGAKRPTASKSKIDAFFREYPLLKVASSFDNDEATHDEVILYVKARQAAKV